MQTNNTYLYQVLADRIVEGGQYTFTFDAQTGNSGADIVPSMFYVNDSNAHVEIVASTIGLSTGAWNNDLSVSFTAAARQPYLGKKLGIKLNAPVPGDMNTNKWIFLDNVRLGLRFAADFNGDYKVNFLDYTELAAAWGSSLGQPNFNNICDLHDNDTIDWADLSLFCDDWLLGLRPLDMWFAADFNSDYKVNFLDYAELAAAWMSSLGQPVFNDVYDLHDDDIIDAIDLGLFCDQWLAGVGP